MSVLRMDGFSGWNLADKQSISIMSLAAFIYDLPINRTGGMTALRVDGFGYAMGLVLT